MRWTWMSVVAALLIAAAIPAGATVTIDSTNATPSAAASAKTGASQWQSALSSRGDCLGTASITFGQLSGRKGEYDTRSAAVTIDPDVDPSEVAAVVVHELSHHAHLRCGAYADDSLKAAFYAAQGLPPERGWFDYSSGWGQTPAEVFAEALTMVTLGTSSHGVAVKSAAVEVVRSWAKGLPVSMPAPPPAQSAPPSPSVADIPNALLPVTVPHTPAASSPTKPGGAAMATETRPAVAKTRSVVATVAIGEANECGAACVYVGAFAAD